MSTPTDQHLALQGKPLPGFAFSPNGRTWRLVDRLGSGQFIESERGALLARLDRAAGCLWLWDKRLGGEVPVRLADLVATLAEPARAGVCGAGMPVSVSG